MVVVVVVVAVVAVVDKVVAVVVVSAAVVVAGLIAYTEALALVLFLCVSINATSAAEVPPIVAFVAVLDHPSADAAAVECHRSCEFSTLAVAVHAIESRIQIPFHGAVDLQASMIPLVADVNVLRI